MPPLGCRTADPPQYRFTSPFGMRWGQLHAGIDLALPSGSKLHAMSTGEVILAKRVPGAGFQLIIRYWDGTQSWFDHLSGYHCKVGEKVVEGTVVGFSGETGHSTGPHLHLHLHLEIHPYGGGPVNPVPWLKAHGMVIRKTA